MRCVIVLLNQYDDDERGSGLCVAHIDRI